MKALRLTADWHPRETYAPSETERITRKAQAGSAVWRNPQIDVTTLPDPELGDDEVMLEVAAVGICGSDMHMYESDSEGYILYPGLTRFPNVLGHEFSGRVVEVGDAVTDLEVGDLVTVEEIQWCGLCDACRKGLVNHCTHMEELGFTTPGAMAELIAVKAKYCWNIAELVARSGGERDALLAAATVEPTGVSYHAMFNRIATWKPGNSCAVFGGGPIGLAAIALARAAGASQVIAFDVSDTRLEMARRMGATSAYDPGRVDDPNALLLELTYGRGVDFVVEAAGAPHHTLTPLTTGLGVGATVTHIGRSERPTPLSLEHYQVRGVHLVGSLGHAGHGTFPNVIRMMASGNLDMTPMISATLPLADAEAAFKRLERREDAKIMLLPNG